MSVYGKYNKSELEDLIFNKNLSYREIGRIFNVSDSYIKKICSKLNITLKKRANFPENWSPHNKGKSNMKHCIKCGCEYISMYKNSKYCTKECEILDKTEKKFDSYLQNQDDFTNVIKNMNFVKKHLMKEQNNCCQICGLENIWNGKNIILILDHIDGDASNNRRENLRLVCPNCDSQLDTYKSKNKNSARKERYLLNYKNYSTTLYSEWDSNPHSLNENRGLNPACLPISPPEHLSV